MQTRAERVLVGLGLRSLKAGYTQRAVEQYSEALESCASAGPPAFVAVLRSNRAAAFQKLKKYTQAIADCLCALALNPKYFKVTPVIWHCGTVFDFLFCNAQLILILFPCPLFSPV